MSRKFKVLRILILQKLTPVFFNMIKMLFNSICRNFTHSSTRKLVVLNEIKENQKIFTHTLRWFVVPHTHFNAWCLYVCLKSKIISFPFGIRIIHFQVKNLITFHFRILSYFIWVPYRTPTAEIIHMFLCILWGNPQQLSFPGCKQDQ